MLEKILIIITLSVVEGITEFLPISSTGHMIIVERIINSILFSKEFMNNFLIIVQFGAILAVLVKFFKKLNPFGYDKKHFLLTMNLWFKIIAALIPTVFIGLILDDYISNYFLDNVYVVAASLIFYGILLIIIEKKSPKNNGAYKINSFTKITYREAFFIGTFQCLAMIPGTSRSGATIIGSLLLGISRTIAAEFSFFLAVPTMFGATLLKLVKSGFNFTFEESMFLLLGVLISFIVAYISINWFMNFIKKRKFSYFGLYRILLGIVVFIYFLKF